MLCISFIINISPFDILRPKRYATNVRGTTELRQVNSLDLALRASHSTTQDMASPIDRNRTFQACDRLRGVIIRLYR